MSKRHNHRRPPVPHWNKGAGFCRWCGEAADGKRRWHPSCLSVFFLATRSANQRQVCRDRDKEVCQCCGLDTRKQQRLIMQTEDLLRGLQKLENRDRPLKPGGFYAEDYDARRAALEARGLRHPPGAWWQADHRKPLVEANGDLSYWSADNLQTLCHWCHAKKSGDDTRRRKGADPAQQPCLAL